MSLSTQELLTKAAQYRELAERMADLAKKREDVEREEKELETILASASDPLLIPFSEGERGILKRRESMICTLLRKEMMKRGPLFDRLNEMRLAPKDANQLSVQLSRMKEDGTLTQNDNGYWIVKGSKWDPEFIAANPSAY